MANTTNFNWETPDDTDLVKDGAAAIRTLGNSIDTSFVDLKGGTTGQVLSKASNTDLDYSWTTPTDQTPLTTKGDLFTYTTTDARLGVGTNGQYLKANSSTSTGLEWADISAGSMTLISTTTLSGASITLSSIAQTYKNLFLVIRNFKPATDADKLSIRFNGDSGTRYNTLGVTGSNLSFGASFIEGSGEADNSASEAIITLEIPDYANTATWKIISIDALTNNATTATNLNFFKRVGVYNQTSAISSITIFAALGNLTSGTCLLYGVN